MSYNEINNEKMPRSNGSNPMSSWHFEFT
ncbi:hypothetical protein SAHC1340_02679 [Staphylococcus aureus]|nr:hypothetical protein SAHC1340_02679 [Staphylococcus aureus]EJE57629.1 hypothetical protein Newbould305_0162 [Staphylococcus aureus subsp. aureus str. Newbould 305]EOR34996.1 hypothetical protein S091751_1127 [Staphylococcus aureus subsp. aureus 091751]EOR35485.1 hypothetical protein S103564_1035 [Staphylococcus aureus subsp. aureus 103564]EOR41427.1 hypothetical protein MRGR3_0648 [Staphylococcus aureus subsp. aureus MRGR3]EOR48752.1 hypothetical protein M140OLGA_1031 [Staphylococcus aureus